MTKPIEPKILAAVTAAVAACLDRSPASLAVRSVTAVPAAGANLWALAGRLNQMNARQAAGRIIKEGRR